MITKYETVVPYTDEAKQMIEELALSKAELATVVNAVKAEVEPRFAEVQGTQADIDRLFLMEMQYTMEKHLRALQEAKKAEVLQ